MVFFKTVKFVYTRVILNIIIQLSIKYQFICLVSPMTDEERIFIKNECKKFI